MADSRTKAVIFDMGGVLLRTEDYGPRSALADQYGLSLQALEQLVFASETAVAAEQGAMDQSDHFQAVSEQLGIEEANRREFFRAFWAGDRVDVPLVDFIRSLRAEYKTALLSNAWNKTRDIVIGIYDFSDAFDVLIFSAEVGMRKPNADIYHYLVEQLGVRPEEALFIDDVAENVEGARRAGLQGIQFHNSAQVRREVLAVLGQSPVH